MYRITAKHVALDLMLIAASCFWGPILGLLAWTLSR